MAGEDADKRVRLFVCRTEQSIQEIPFYPFNAPPEHDDTRNYLLQLHAGHVVDWGDVLESQWNNPQLRVQITKEIVQQMKAPGEAEGLGAEFYSIKATFKEDAFQCWRRHNRTTDCGDWHADNKRLFIDTREDRKEIGLSVKTSDRPNTYLCDFCPVASIRQSKIGKAKGWHN
jgi:hypothetical protein